ncbi:2-isopropylmalate synthase [Saccharopolyspora erythraea NRRL 2338]|uniref:2-isopropylmalate synthase n=2 Tax=Saccharopolyspora erythraea TaxID=1836 RepID=A4FLG7_SACEN|nr:2-isopropylmalate synthase [Saccharopolyspora erythraea D]QRK93867.1 2-isopropylmalate synthase [Saccharopolyspora erythraea]CAM04892.1 2-isopropylmalate synthase [Saccharopolyspora erythraea NRRL 2338]
MPHQRYRDVFDRVPVPAVERTWPANRITEAPLWVPVDLRDGNQALPEPMDPARKRRFFEMLVRIGYKEIEVGYPSASQTDFDFVRMLANSDLVPDDVTVSVFTPARRDLIERTFEAIEGLDRVIVHMYTATAPVWRDVVLRTGRDELREMIRTGVQDVLRCAEGRDGVRFEFSPEVFNQTEPEFALEVCDSVTELWQAGPGRPVIVNLPATVEVATPNVYADQIEHMHRNLARREHVILSVHPHNDRGTGVACAELAVLAGAQRVEGCLFGNGERTGNVDLVTLALNLHAQGVDPMIDFSDVDSVRETVEHCNRIGVHERHPYVGEYVHTAFSGTHQDAIRKGFRQHAESAARAGVPVEQARWEVPYLPIDPKDIGRDYEAVIRVNSQSGKGGIAHVMQTEHQLDLPRGLQRDFSRVVQRHTDETGTEVDAATLWELFAAEYLVPGAVGLKEWSIGHGPDGDRLRATLEVDGEPVAHQVTADGAVSALVRMLAQHGRDVEIVNLVQQSVGAGDRARAATYLEHRVGASTRWAVGIDDSVIAASLAAVLGAANSATAGS